MLSNNVAAILKAYLAKSTLISSLAQYTVKSSTATGSSFHPLAFVPYFPLSFSPLVSQGI